MLHVGRKAGREGEAARRRAPGPAIAALFVGLALLAAPARAAEQSPHRLRLATTTSTQNSGLLDVLLPPFEKANRARVDVIAVGTGKALKLGENGDVDVVLVHAPAAEEEFMAGGFGVDRRAVMHNDFVVVGPKDDPAGIGKTGSVRDAFRRLASSGARFVSRGDDSGTHKKEREIWQAAGVAPGGAWYVESGQGMGAVLRMADEQRAYALADRGTYLAYAGQTELAIVLQGVPPLHNPYSVIAVNPARHPGVRHELARSFIDYLTGAEAQALIAGFRRSGQQLFFPDALAVGRGPGGAAAQRPSGHAERGTAAYLFEATARAFGLIVGLDREVYYVVWTSLRVVVAACALAALGGVPLGLTIALRRFRGRGVVLLALNTAMALPTVVVGLLLYAFLSRRGPLGALGLLYTPAGIILGEFVLALPIVTNLTVAAIRGLDPRVVLTCKSLGASARQQAWMVLGEARYAVMAAIVAGFGRVLSEIGIAMMIGGNIAGFTRTMTTAIALETSKGEFELALALGILLLLVALVVNAALHRLQRGPS